MVNVDSLPKLLARSRRLPLLILATMLLGLALSIFLTARYLRSNTRAQIISRDGEILTAVARMQADAISQDFGEADILEEAWVQQLVLLESSKLAGVLGTRLFNAEGRFVETFPTSVLEARLSREDLPSMRALKPVGHYYPNMPLHDLFYPESTEWESMKTTQPILMVNVPLHTSANPSLMGVAQFLVQGQTIAAEFKRLDQNLFSVGLIIFLATGLSLSLISAWFFRRLNRINQRLTERTRQLVLANQELTLAAKTSVVGTLTSHLIHGLKNPLSGLQNFMAHLETDTSTTPVSDRQDAIASTRRMQALIQQVVGVLREQESDHHYEMTMEELVEMVRNQLDKMAREKEVTLQFHLETNQALNNRVSSLVGLILMNLLQNAVQATASGKNVTLTIRSEPDELVWEVMDEGPGFPDSQLPSLFQPCQSTKLQGSGIGLALSKQLATHLDATLELKESGPGGCRFVLRLPQEPGSPDPSSSSTGKIR